MFGRKCRPCRRGFMQWAAAGARAQQCRMYFRRRSHPNRRGHQGLSRNYSSSHLYV
ncbi:hypothetical protein I551_4229 [Mycobacterium ulcerans str. Harvey]|uniref:Uncharacterized protein n=1 Tax=Mycobacterium ulcerans str. Harvey TaxID=1299332 RepID=A0ABP3AG66_MYCUL|nr:hypothetical protein I551_4229 [Mycobacterium ulcerans str. Harvey]